MVTTSVDQPITTPAALIAQAVDRRLSQRTQEMALSLRDMFGFREPFASFIASGLVQEQWRRDGEPWLWQGMPKLERDAVIRLKFNGRNHKQLADEFAVTVRTIYRVVDPEGLGQSLAPSHCRQADQPPTLASGGRDGRIVD